MTSQRTGWNTGPWNRGRWNTPFTCTLPTGVEAQVLLNSAIPIPPVVVPVTGEQILTALGTVVVESSTVVQVTGNSLLVQISGVNIWSQISPINDPGWIEIDPVNDPGWVEMV